MGYGDEYVIVSAPPLPPDDGRREAVIILSAPRGDVKAARSLVSRALSLALGRQTHGTPPHHIYYHRAVFLDGYWHDPRYLLDVTDEEMQRVSATIYQLAMAEGWSGPPVDIYHD